MVPVEKVKEIILKHKTLEKELSSGNVEPKLFAKKSKEYSTLESIIKIAKEYVNFEGDKIDLLNMIQDKSNDQEMVDLAQRDLDELIEKKKNTKMILNYFYYQKMKMIIKMQL